MKSGEAGEILNLAVHTVRTYVKAIKKKLNVYGGHRRLVRWFRESREE